MTLPLKSLRPAETGLAPAHRSGRGDSKSIARHDVVLEDAPLTWAERVAYEALSQGDAEKAVDAAEAADRNPAEGWMPSLAWRMRRVLEDGMSLDGYGQGVSEKQFSILSAMVGEDNPGMSARDLEAPLARSLSRNYVGWGAGDITTSLHRLMARGLVRREERLRVKVRDPKWVWFVTDAGSELTTRWLKEKGYW